MNDRGIHGYTGFPSLYEPESPSAGIFTVVTFRAYYFFSHHHHYPLLQCHQHHFNSLCHIYLYNIIVIVNLIPDLIPYSAVLRIIAVRCWQVYTNVFGTCYPPHRQPQDVQRPVSELILPWLPIAIGAPLRTWPASITEQLRPSSTGARR